MNRHLRHGLLLVLLALGIWQLSAGVWIHAKAQLAQMLIGHAWTQSLAGEREVRPWPWADTRPVARLRVPSRDIDLMVLSGDSGRTLAFGPGHATGSALPGEPGAIIISGHRDTHFRFLKHLLPGERILLDTRGISRAYAVVQANTIDARKEQLLSMPEVESLVLVTCYPFDAVAPGGPLRYVVHALPEDLQYFFRVRLDLIELGSLRNLSVSRGGDRRAVSAA